MTLELPVDVLDRLTRLAEIEHRPLKDQAVHLIALGLNTALGCEPTAQRTRPAAAGPPSNGPWLSSRAVAGQLGVDHATLCRWLAAGKVPGAWRTPTGYWRLPVDAAHQLQLAGMASNASSNGVTEDVTRAHADDPIPDDIYLSRFLKTASGFH